MHNMLDCARYSQFVQCKTYWSIRVQSPHGTVTLLSQWKKQRWPVKCDQTVRSMLLIRHSLCQHHLNQCSASVFFSFLFFCSLYPAFKPFAAFVESLCLNDMSEPGHISTVWNRKCLVECAWGSVKTVMCNMLPLLWQGVCVCFNYISMACSVRWYWNLAC